MPSPDLLTYLRDYLVSEGLVRVPRVAGAAPPLYLEPKEGVVAPGEAENATESHPTLVLGAFRATGVAPRRHQSFIRIDMIDLVVRAANPRPAFDLHDELRGALVDKRHWSMAGLLIEESLMFRDLQRVSSDANGWTFTTEFSFERWDGPEGLP